MVYNDCIDNYYLATNTDGTASKNNSSKNVPSLLDSIRDELHKMTEGTRLGNGNMIHHTNGTTKEIRVIADEDAHPAGGRGEHGDYLQVHNVLGMGTFAQVTCVTIENHQQDPQQQQQQQQRYYACKSVKKELLTNSHTWCNTNGNRRKEYVNVIAQLANEVHVLSNFDHPNIIKLRGVQSHRNWLSTSSVTTSAVSDSHNTNGHRHQQQQQRHQQEGMIYMLTDVLRETLDGRIDRWKQSNRIIDNAKVNHSHNGRRQQLLQSIDKLNVCLQLASALEYVHTKNIVYRDLKPQNIGFDDQGVLQLFDFGLCRELTPSRPKATGIIGTMRYMAPEVCLEQHYDVTCDLYSFGVVGWEIWTHRLPYVELTPELYRDWVCQRGYRPTSTPPPSTTSTTNAEGGASGDDGLGILPQEVALLLSHAWHHDPSQRIQWSQLQEQFQLFKQLEHLRLEEYDLSSSLSAS